MTQDRQRLSRAESQVQTRNRLLTAAAEVFAEAGLDAASLDEIAKRAGYSKGAVYSNFESKEDLAQAVLIQSSSNDAAQLEAELRNRATEEAFWVDLAKRAASDVQGLLSLELWVKAWHNDHLRQRLADERQQTLRSLAHVLANGTEPQTKHLDASGAINAMLSGVALQHALDPDPSLLTCFARFAVQTIHDLDTPTT